MLAALVGGPTRRDAFAVLHVRESLSDLLALRGEVRNAARPLLQGNAVLAALVGGPPRRDAFACGADCVRHRPGSGLLQVHAAPGGMDLTEKVG